MGQWASGLPGFQGADMTSVVVNNFHVRCGPPYCHEEGKGSWSCAVKPWVRWEGVLPRI